MPGKNPRQIKEGSARAWNLEEIQELLDLLVQREISEFEMERGGLKIRIKRGNSRAESFNPGSYAEPPLERPAPAPAPRPASEDRGATPPVAEAPAAEPAEGLHIIKSPIVGTFYASPAPNAPPFVTPGDVVEVGQVLCIIEAMKLMNEIESEVAGEVVRAYVENGQPVEYGESLFAIKPSLKR
jgi:acetyl-CoA carboxylase biotin carboxyl carrier protein